MTDGPNGDGGRYECVDCGIELPLADWIDHFEIAHPDLEPTRRRDDDDWC